MCVYLCDRYNNRYACSTPVSIRIPLSFSRFQWGAEFTITDTLTQEEIDDIFLENWYLYDSENGLFPYPNYRRLYSITTQYNDDLTKIVKVQIIKKEHAYESKIQRWDS